MNEKRPRAITNDLLSQPVSEKQFLEYAASVRHLFKVEDERIRRLIKSRNLSLSLALGAWAYIVVQTALSLFRLIT